MVGVGLVMMKGASNDGNMKQKRSWRRGSSPSGAVMKSMTHGLTSMGYHSISIIKPQWSAADWATTIQSKIIQVGRKPQLVKYWLTPIESIGEPAFVIEGLHFSPSEVLVVKSRERWGLLFHTMGDMNSRWKLSASYKWCVHGTELLCCQYWLPCHNLVNELCFTHYIVNLSWNNISFSHREVHV